ncbi:hypothetical protein CMU20_00005 [Elizabethkingia anophelis]|nr:hypothetical protein [Elizabethkingia anophelis]MDV3951617.1 hypothetical protein [Elizabethkingia anophelis]MDV3955023.1 hypothetical protein [Elizabethkingia anophelis]
MISNNSNKNLSDSVSLEITNTTLDLAIDYAEVGMDEFLDGALKEIPFVKTLYSFGKIGYSIRERFFVKKLLTFLQEFHSKEIQIDNLNNFKNRFDSDEKYKEKVVENLLVYTDTFLNIEKAKIFAKLFRNYINEKYDWKYFLGLADCLNSVNINAFDFLREMAEVDYEISETPEERKIPRNGDKEALLYSCGIAYQSSTWSSSFNISQVGKDLYEYGIKN